MAVFTTGAIAGLIIGQAIWQFVITNFFKSEIKNAQLYNTILIIGCAIICGLIAFKFVNFVLRAITAFIGSFMVTSGAAYFISVKYMIYISYTFAHSQLIRK